MRDSSSNAQSKSATPNAAERGCEQRRDSCTADNLVLHFACAPVWAWQPNEIVNASTPTNIMADRRQPQDRAIVVGSADQFGALVVNSSKQFLKKHPVISLSWVVGLFVSILASGYTPSPEAVMNYEVSKGRTAVQYGCSRFPDVMIYCKKGAALHIAHRCTCSWQVLLQPQYLGVQVHDI